MGNVSKYAIVKGFEPADTDMDLINRLTLRELKREEVFAFRVVACDDQVDRDNERFTVEALEKLAELFVGKPILMDHSWSAEKQSARIYAAQVEEQAGIHRLVLRAYMLRNEATADVIASIEGGILREVSVGCAMGKAICSICGTDKAVGHCVHRPGAEYEGKKCHVDLDDARDAYECSFVAVPAQKDAGVVKRYGGEDSPGQEPGEDEQFKLAQARQELEEKRFVGGNEV